MFFGKVKYINTPAEFELVTFRLEVRHHMKNVPNHLKLWMGIYKHNVMGFG